MSHRLPLCPSNDDPSRPVDTRFHASACVRKSCCFWSDGCNAGLGLTKEHAKHGNLDRAAIAACPIAVECRWHLDAVARGEPTCVVRRLGMLCEHQGGDWATFDMVSPSDPIWRIIDEEWP